MIWGGNYVKQYVFYLPCLPGTPFMFYFDSVYIHTYQG